MTTSAEQRAVHLLVLTGAGISADSGVRTFRDHGGLWEGQRPEDVATPQAWRRDRRLVWRFYQQRRAQLGEVSPNPAHAALADLERQAKLAGGAFTLVTQNVDDLHERAGSQPIHMHGELAWLRCERCERRVRDLEHLSPDEFVPCPACGHDALRPDIVWFGEPLDPHVLGAAFEAADACDALICVGSSLEVEPAASIPFRSIRRGAVVIEINPAPTSLTEHADAGIRGNAAEVLPVLFREVWG